MMLRSLEKSLGPFSPSSSIPLTLICILRARASHRAKKELFILATPIEFLTQASPVTAFLLYEPITLCGSVLRALLRRVIGSK